MPAPIAITCGDISGISPEIIQHVLKEHEKLSLPELLIIGPRALFGETANISCVDIPVTGKTTPGAPNDVSAHLSWQALEKAAELALCGTVRAVVTTPVHKASLYEAGFTWPGQTEFFADRCGVARHKTAMMLAGPALRTVPLTIHIPLKDVPQKLTAALIVEQAQVVYHALMRDFGLPAPKLALAGLNPHAGEDGHLGAEEKTILRPACDMLRAQHITIDGPLPGDTLFAAGMRAKYDAILCPYHDQALIPVKTLDLKQTVNVTLGLPIIRTSPDHGTAHSIAGKGLAWPDSLIAAIRLAAHMADKRG